MKKKRIYRLLKHYTANRDTKEITTPPITGQKIQQKDQERNPLCNQALSSCHVLLLFLLGDWDHQPQTKMAEKYNRRK